tara:strand:- start:45 stop:656 length:612 start_codon:yes stop_codon:yes gene_type:complete
MANPFKWCALGVGGLVAVAHIGVLGHLMNYQMKTTEKYADRPQFPAINLPTGPYSSYKVDVGKEGYRIDYKSNDPKVLTTTKSSSVDKEYDEKGMFGKSSKGSVQTESYNVHEYTMEGDTNLQGGELPTKGKSWNAEDLACIKSEGAGESTGGMVGASITASAAPILTGIPYVGWLAAGWATLLGQNMGKSVGGEIAKTVSGC